MSTISVICIAVPVAGYMGVLTFMVQETFAAAWASGNMVMVWLGIASFGGIGVFVGGIIMLGVWSQVGPRKEGR